jgi:anti-sigma B factor antagonist
MPIHYEDVGDQLRRIRFSGRLDIPGTQAIAPAFADLTCDRARRVVVDLRNVEFLASIGLREIISVAKELRQKGGKMVLCVGENGFVAKTLDVTGIDTLIPTHTSMPEADRDALA